MTGAPAARHLDEQAKSYVEGKDDSPAALLNHLNGLATSLRSRERAVADRDRIIHDLRKSIDDRDVLVERLTGRLRYAKIRVALLYAVVGGAAAKGAEELVIALVHLFIRWIQHA